MKEYTIKCELKDKESLTTYIKSRGGNIVYFSPVLPILGAELSEDVKFDVEEKFNLTYIMESPNGQLQEIKGSLSELPKSPVILMPGLNSKGLRNINKLGWGTTVAVLDSGVSESWISEHVDYTGFGSMPAIDHGTKVANIIKQFAPGSKILSYKVCQGKDVSFFNVMKAIDDAVIKADIINISIGFKLSCSLQNPCSLCEAVNYYTVNSGKLFVVAAGNVGKENSIECPGNAQESITVGSVNHDSFELAPYSSRGVPGIKKPNIITTGTIYYTEGPMQGISNGTSFSTPIVSGVCASLFHELDKNISKTKAYLYNTAKDLGLPEHHQGFGLLDLNYLLEVLQNDQGNSKSEGQIPN